MKCGALEAEHAMGIQAETGGALGVAGFEGAEKALVRSSFGQMKTANVVGG